MLGPSPPPDLSIVLPFPACVLTVASDISLYIVFPVLTSKIFFSAMFSCGNVFVRILIIKFYGVPLKFNTQSPSLLHLCIIIKN